MATSMDRRHNQKRRRTRSQGALELADLARFRQKAYRLLSTMLLYPDEERLRTVAAIATELGCQTDFLAAFPFFSQWTKLLDVIQGLAELEPARVQEEYVHNFVVNPDCSPCLPCESLYLGSGAAVSGWTAVQLEREYRTAGLAISPSLEEPPDHVAVELDFMSYLCDQEASAWEMGRLVNGIGALKRQAAFLDQHLSRWFPTFARRVKLMDGSGVYTSAAVTTHAFISHDRDLLTVLVERFRSRAESQQATSVSKGSPEGMR